MWWLAMVWSLMGPGLAWSGLDQEANWWGESWGPTTPSLSPYSDLDLPETLAFTRTPGTPWIDVPVRPLTVTVYTDRPALWTPLRYKSVMRLARWYLARCRIRLRVPRLRTLPRGTLTRNHRVRWKIPRKLTVTRAPDETLIFLTRSVAYDWGRGAKRRRVRLLGVSASVVLRRSRGQWLRRKAVWVRASPVFTTLVHELGHRLGLKHVAAPYRLMVTGSGVRSSLRMLWTSMLGYFAPVRFGFAPAECHTMHRTLRQERQRKRVQKKKKAPTK